MAVYSNYNKSNDTVLNEVYFGRQPELQRAEEVLGKFRQRYYDNKYINSAQTDSLLQEFCNIIADFFGFKDYYLILKSETVANSSTRPLTWGFTGQVAKVTKTKTGYKYDGTVTMIQYIYNYVLFDPEYTDAEIMAICLHEIGHNFSAKKSNIVQINSLMIMAATIYSSLITLANGQIPLGVILNGTQIGNWFRKEAFKTMSENETIEILVSLFKFIIALPTSVVYNINSAIGPIRALVNLPFIIPQRLLKMPLTLMGFVDERIADQYATIYGYGPELYTGLEKMRANTSHTVKAIHKTPVLGWVYDLINIPVSTVLTLMDPHPTHASRRKAQYRYIEKELEKDGIPPHIRKNMMMDLERMEDDLKKIEKRAKDLEGTAVADTYQVLVNKLSRGDDLREYLSSHKIDDAEWENLGESTYMNLVNDVKLL